MDEEITFFPDKVKSESLWNDPEILEALATGYRKVPNGLVEGYTGPGTEHHPEVALASSDHGEKPSPGPGDKRSLDTPEDIQPRTRNRDRNHPTSLIGAAIAPHCRLVQQTAANVARLATTV